MKYTVSKETQDYVKRLEQDERRGVKNTEYHIYPDSVDQIITENGLRIEGISFYPQIDLMLVVLNNKKVLKRNISDFESLRKASLEHLLNYEISPMGVHWVDLNEDLSLRGFLKHEIAFSDNAKVV